MESLRWRLADDHGPQEPLFAAEGDVPGRRPLPGVEYLHVRARRVISEVPGATRLPFRFTLNVYRGCAHACMYCYARPTHGFIGLGATADFERRIVVKINAVERLRAELAAPSWAGDHVAMGTNTDPYQPAEGRYRLTRGAIEAFLDAGNPFTVLTKSPMIVRDIDLLAEAARRGLVRTALSIGTVDDELARRTEPGAPPPAQRLAAVSALREAGVPCGVLVAPVIPGITDGEERLDATIGAVVAAGADRISSHLLFLRDGIRELVDPWLGEHRPDLRGHYRRLYGPSGYVPESVRREHAELVGRLVAAHGGALASDRGTPADAAHGPVRPARALPAAAQLALAV